MTKVTDADAQRFIGLVDQLEQDVSKSTVAFNGGETDTYTSNNGVEVPSYRKWLKDKEGDIANAEDDKIAAQQAALEAQQQAGLAAQSASDAEASAERSENAALVSEGAVQAFADDLAAPGGAGLVGNGGIVFDSVADMQTATWLKVGQKVRTLGYYTSGDGGGNDYEIVAAGAGTDDGGSFIDLSGSELQAKGLFAIGYSTPEQFGAIGDAVSDDTLRIQECFNYHLDVEITKQHLVSSVHQTIPGQSISSSERGLLIGSVIDSDILTVSGNDSKIIVNIDGANIASTGIRVTENCQNYNVSYCSVINIRSNTKQAFGILSTSHLGGKIENNTVKSVFSLGNGSSGDGPGLSRAIQFLPTLTPIGFTYIKYNKLFDIFGEEGDVISVQVTPTDWNGVYPYPDSLCYLRGNTAVNWTRRFIKNQGSGTVISDNIAKFVSNDGSGLLTSFAISIIASDNCIVTKNILDMGGIWFAINTDGSNVHTNKNTTINLNTIKNNGAGAAISIRQASGVNCSKNEIGVDHAFDVFAVGISSASDINVSRNEFFGAIQGYIIASTTDSFGLTISKNISMMTQAKRFINAPSSNCVITENCSNGTVFSSGVIGLNDILSEGSAVRNNTALGATTGIIVNKGSANVNEFGNIAT